MKTCSPALIWYTTNFNTSHQACHHPTLLRLLKEVRLRCTAARRLLEVHPKRLQLSFLHAVTVFYHRGAPVLAVQCSELQEAAARIKRQPSQEVAEESQSEGSRTQRGQDRAQRGSDQQSRTGWRVCTGLEVETYLLQWQISINAA